MDGEVLRRLIREADDGVRVRDLAGRRDGDSGDRGAGRRQLPGRRRAAGPRLLAAGDAAQTVRASGFDWSRYSAAIGQELATRPASFALETSARTPARIAEVLERLRSLYTGIEKGQRPTRQQPAAGGDESLQADLAHVRLTDQDEARRTVKRLAAEPLVAILQPDPDPAGWIDAETAALTIDPEGAKGLEYRARRWRQDSVQPDVAERDEGHRHADGQRPLMHGQAKATRPTKRDRPRR